MPIKWIDNLLSHHAVPGVSGGRQGIDRMISMEGLISIEIVRIAVSEVGVPLRRGVELATAAMRQQASPDSIRTPSGAEIRFPIVDIERRLRERLVEAVDAAPSPPRGRPRRDLP